VSIAQPQQEKLWEILMFLDWCWYLGIPDTVFGVPYSTRRTTAGMHRHAEAARLLVIFVSHYLKKVKLVAFPSLLNAGRLRVLKFAHRSILFENDAETKSFCKYGTATASCAQSTTV
jgi:hypothetical protein